MADQTERSFQRQPTIFLNRKKGLGAKKRKSLRYTRNVGLGFKTPRENERAFQKQPGVFLAPKPGLKKKALRRSRSVGLGFKTPREAIEGTYIDKKCPFTGNVSIRGRILTGLVQKMKMQRTIVIRRDYLHYIRKYNRFEKRHRNMSVHLSPCFSPQTTGWATGDLLQLEQCKLSREIIRDVCIVTSLKLPKTDDDRKPCTTLIDCDDCPQTTGDLLQLEQCKLSREIIRDVCIVTSLKLPKTDDDRKPCTTLIDCDDCPQTTGWATGDLLQLEQCKLSREIIRDVCIVTSLKLPKTDDDRKPCTTLIDCDDCPQTTGWATGDLLQLEQCKLSREIIRDVCIVTSLKLPKTDDDRKPCTTLIDCDDCPQTTGWATGDLLQLEQCKLSREIIRDVCIVTSLKLPKTDDDRKPCTTLIDCDDCPQTTGDLLQLEQCKLSREIIRDVCIVTSLKLPKTDDDRKPCTTLIDCDDCPQTTGDLLQLEQCKLSREIIRDVCIVTSLKLPKTDDDRKPSTTLIDCDDWDVNIGDVVTVGECRPLSKTVRFNVLKVTKGTRSKKSFKKF